MTRLNTAVTYLPDGTRNARVQSLTASFRRADNARFFADVGRRIETLRADLAPGEDVLCIGLIGEYGLFGYGIRRAQELLRVDRQPSYWSHAFLIADTLSADPRDYRSVSTAPHAWECALYPARDYAAFAERAGVSPRSLADYGRVAYDVTNPHAAPNVAVIGIVVTSEERQRVFDAADNPDIDQVRYDLNDLRGVWFRYLASPTNQSNPIKAGYALHSAAYVQLGLDAAGIDLAVGSAQRAVTPEHFWQAATYLYPMVRRVSAESAVVPRAVMGWYCVRNEACLAAPLGFSIEASIRNRLGSEQAPSHTARPGPSAGEE